jgi:hypothetical protein
MMRTVLAPVLAISGERRDAVPILDNGHPVDPAQDDLLAAAVEEVPSFHVEAGTLGRRLRVQPHHRVAEKAPLPCGLEIPVLDELR